MEKQLIEINSNNLLFNYEYYSKNTYKNIIAVIKDNAYGHGFKQIIEVLEKTNIKLYAVANLEEALEVEKYTQKDILILDKVSDFTQISPQIIISIISVDHLYEAINASIPIRIHLKINTGMNRKGIFPHELKECIALIESNPCISLEGFYTHYASNKKSDLKKQYECLKSTLKGIDKNKYLIHASSSVSSLILKENFTNTCRIGIGLYGLNHRYEVMKAVKPVLSLYSTVDKCTQINKNIKVGYSFMFKTPTMGYLILSPIGYAKGYLIRQNYYAYYKGVYLKQMCRVCMDCCIYFSKSPIKEDEKIEIFGEHVSVDEISRINKCSPYEIVTLLNKNIKRIVI